MGDELTYESILKAVDDLLELSPQKVSSVGESWPKLEEMLGGLLEAAEFDAARHGRLAELMNPLVGEATKLIQSLLNMSRGGPLRGDWARFVERDLPRLKDELLGLREFLVAEAEFLKFACLRAKLKHPDITNPEKIFEELHRAGAISERTWVLLMAQPNTWRKALKDREISQELSRISSWLIDLQEARRGRKCLAKKMER